ncbi:MAG: ADP-ribosylglycohydrolase family protein [Thiolinea sp.]
MSEQERLLSLNQATGMLVGLAVGDAVGTTLEFQPRGSFHPIHDMVGGGPFNLKPGQWTDDTSMALCLAQSLIHQKAFDPVDQMNRYCNWYQHGYMSATGECFDIGMTVRGALQRFLADGNPYAGSTNPRSAGNGSIMRFAPVVLAYHDHEKLFQYARDSSRTTHGAEEAVEACAVFASILRNALQGKDKFEVITEHQETSYAAKIAAIQTGEFLMKSRHEIRGSGYVVDALEAALWCFYRTDSFREAVLRAANLGDDADTTAAICGQVAGAYYGYDGIPPEWLDKLYWRQEIVEMAEGLFKWKV